jgi:EmrB/QacA subfamily drug resistance transporter
MREAPSQSSPATLDDGDRRFDPADPPGPKRRISVQQAAAIAYVTSMFMGAMDNHIVNVALPTLSRQFRAPVASVQWTVIAYVLSLAVFIPASGWIGDRIGTKKTFLFALALFTVASALCGQARNLDELVAARALQGAGGGMLAPVATAMLWRAYPPSQRARLARILILPILVAPAAAPVLGGLLIEDLSWRYAFYVNVPFGIAAMVIASRYLAEHREQPEGRFDLLGFVLSGGGLSLLLYAISEGSLVGWGSPVVLITGFVALISLAAFTRLELRRTDSPLLRLGLLSNRLFRATNAATGLSTASFLGILYLTPIFLQEARHQSPLSSGLTTFVEAIGVVFATQTVGRLYGRIGPRRMTGTGMTVLALLILSLTLVGPSTNQWWIRLIMFFAGAANSTAFLPMQTAMFTSIAPADTGHASAIFNAQRQTMLALGVAILSTVVSSVGGDSYAAFHDAYFAAAGMAVIGSVLAFTLVHDSDAKATMVRTGRAVAGDRVVASE